MSNKKLGGFAKFVPVNEELQAATDKLSSLYVLQMGAFQAGLSIPGELRQETVEVKDRLYRLLEIEGEYQI